MEISKENNAVWSPKNDPRITFSGKFLRRLRIDELPQLLNILKGDMSLVGPRPEQTDIVLKLEKEIPKYKLRHLIKPGLSGWAQVWAPYSASVESTKEKLSYDLYYVKNRSIYLYLKTLLQTTEVILISRFNR